MMRNESEQMGDGRWKMDCKWLKKNVGEGWREAVGGEKKRKRNWAKGD